MYPEVSVGFLHVDIYETKFRATLEKHSKKHIHRRRSTRSSTRFVFLSAV